MGKYKSLFFLIIIFLPLTICNDAVCLLCLSNDISFIAKADKIQFVSSLPKTRSGKIMRRILRKIASGNSEDLGDTSTLLDPSVVDEIKSSAQ